MWSNIIGRMVCTPGIPEGDPGYFLFLSSLECGAWSDPKTSTTEFFTATHKRSKCSFFLMGGFIWAKEPNLS